MKRLLCAAVLAVGVNSPAGAGEYIVGTKTKEKSDAKGAVTEPKGGAGYEYGDVTSINALPDEHSFGDKKAGEGFFTGALHAFTVDDDVMGMSGGSWFSQPMSTETLEYLVLEIPLPCMVRDLPAMKENVWLRSYAKDQALPLGGKVVVVTYCEIAMARAWMNEIGAEVPGSEETPDLKFSEQHIYYGESEPPEYIIPARWCRSPGFWGKGENCVTHYNRVHYQKILEYAEAWKQAHPDKAKCFVYRALKPPEKTTVPSTSGDFTDFVSIKKWWDGKKWQYEQMPKRPRP